MNNYYLHTEEYCLHWNDVFHITTNIQVKYEMLVDY